MTLFSVTKTSVKYKLKEVTEVRGSPATWSEKGSLEGMLNKRQIIISHPYFSLTKYKA